MPKQDAGMEQPTTYWVGRGRWRYRLLVHHFVEDGQARVRVTAQVINPAGEQDGPVVAEYRSTHSIEDVARTDVECWAWEFIGAQVTRKKGHHEASKEMRTIGMLHVGRVTYHVH